MSELNLILSEMRDFREEVKEGLEGLGRRVEHLETAVAEKIPPPPSPRDAEDIAQLFAALGEVVQEMRAEDQNPVPAANTIDQRELMALLNNCLARYGLNESGTIIIPNAGNPNLNSVIEITDIVAGFQSRNLMEIPVRLVNKEHEESGSRIFETLRDIRSLGIFAKPENPVLITSTENSTPFIDYSSRLLEELNSLAYKNGLPSGW